MLARFLNGEEELRAGRPDHILEVEAGGDELSDGSPLAVHAVVHMPVLVHVEIEDLLLDHLGVFALKWVMLVEYVVDAAPQRPDVNFVAEAALFENELRGRVVDMTAEVAAPEEFFEVVRQAHRIELDNAAFELLNSAGMDVSVDVVVRVEELERTDNLVEHVKGLVVGHALLAVGLPLADGVWGFHLYEQEVVGHDPIVIDRDQMLVLEVLQRVDHLDCATPLFLVKCRDVNARHHFIFVGLLVVHEENLTITLAIVE